MPQVIDGSKKNFNTTVVGASVTVIAQYAVRTAYNRQYYPNNRVFEFNNRPVWGENILSFVTPLVITTTPTIRLTVTGTNNYLLLTGTTFNRVKVSTETAGYSTATRYFITGTNAVRLPINMYSGGVGTVSTVTDIQGQPNIYGVALITTGTYAFAIEQLTSTQTSSLSVNSIITVNTSSNSTGNFGTGNTAYVYAINSNQIIVVATSGTTAPVNGTIDGITNTGQTFYVAPTPPLVVDLLVVAGGGSGGNHNTTNSNGGGGGGGLLYASSLTLSLTESYNVIVGDGGAAIPNSTAGVGKRGGNSSFGIYIAQGGGGGASSGSGAATSGGSGGGAAANGGGGAGASTQATIGTAVGYGNAGGASATAQSGAGGGGAGGAGISGTGSSPGGNGGQGRAYDISGTWKWYAGGGGGGGNSSEAAGDGYAGGGRGAGTTAQYSYANYPAQGTVNAVTTGSATPNAIPNTGGGGGGGSYWASNGGWSFGSGAGGSGIVIVRYPGAQRASGGTVTSVGGNTIHTFTSTGSTFVFAAGSTVFPTFRDPTPVGWKFTVTNLASTIGYKIGDIVSSVPRAGRLGNDSSLIYLTDVNTATNSIAGISFGTTSPLIGNINAIYSTGDSMANVVVSNVSTSAPYTFVVGGLKNTSGLTAGNPGSVITATNAGGSFGAGNTVIVQAILGYTSLLAYVTSGTSVPVPGIVTNFTATGALVSLPVVGQVAYTTTGTYSWTAPAGVTSVNVVAVGGGGGGSYVWSGGGGGGGGLGWKNNIPVTPGQTYTVVVGTGGLPSPNATNSAAAGGTSYFISTATVAGYGGGQGGPNSTSFGGGYGGGYLGDAGGRGGNAAFQGSWNVGGGGAGGYSGNGADNGGGYFTAYNAPVGSGAGAASGYYSSTYGVPAGGGVGIFGRGADGVGSSTYFGGGGGSGGEAGRGGEGSGQQGYAIINGGAFGGGGGGSGSAGTGGGWGGRGAVRIIWGSGRSFPVTLTADQGTVATLPTVTQVFKNENVGGSSFSYLTNKINATPLVLQQNVVPRTASLTVTDSRRLTLQRQQIVKTGSEFSLRNNSTPVTVLLSISTQTFSTGTVQYLLPMTTEPGGVGFIGTVTQIPSQPNIYGVAAANTTSWVFAIENLSSTQTSSLTFGSVVTANTTSNSTGNFGTNNTTWVYSIGVGYVIFVATGGATPPVNGTIDRITITGQTYIPPLVTTVDLLVVGGGGSGGNHSTTNANGGGGAGGLLYGAGINISTGSYAVVVGQGGAAVPNATNATGNKGTSSTFGTTFIAHGGGGGVSGGTAYNAVASNGGSGGGFGGPSGGGPGLSTQINYGGATGYGNQGGASYANYTGGGGGGAGSAGVSGSAGTAPAGDGGQGRAYDISGTWRWYAGGGGGGGNSSERAGDGYAGGGRGAGTTLRYAYNVYTAEVNSITTGSGTPNAIPNTGGGGGGGSYWSSNGGWSSGSGAGGSGIVIVRYLGSGGTGGTITSANGYTIHTFTSDGTFVFNGSYGLAIPTFRAPVQSPWTFAITGTSVVGFTTGSIISALPRAGSFGSNNEVYITSIDTGTNSINCFAWAKGPYSTSPTSGIINAIYPTGSFNTNPLVSGITTAAPGYKFTISNIKGTLLYSTGTIFTATSITGSLGTGSTAVVVSVDSFTQIQAYASGGTTPVAGYIGTPTLSLSTSTIPQTGDIAYVTTGTYSWTAPTGVTSVSVVAVGGGGAGGYTWSSGGGGGGGLGWKNNISVTPGQSYTVVVGTGGVPTSNATNAAAAGGTSYFISTATVAGYGGGQGGPNSTAYGSAYGGGYQGDGGGAGGRGATDGSWNYGGAGAGGYAGNGASSFGGTSSGTAAPAGSGAGAAGGWYSSTYGVPAGGGVGIYGQGADGTASGQYYGGGGGSGGQQGRGGEGSGQYGYSIINGGAFGGGGGGSGSAGTGGGWGGGGAVRIIWGSGRSFPATNAGTLTSVVSAATVDPTKNFNIGGEPTVRDSLLGISVPKPKIQNTVPTQVIVTINSSTRPSIKTLVHVPTDLTNSTDYEMAPSVTTKINSDINPSTTGTYVYRPTEIIGSTSSWIFRIYNIPSNTVSSLTTSTIITANTSSGKSGSFGVGSTVTVYSIASATSIIARAYGGSVAPTPGVIDSISVPGGTYTPPATVYTAHIFTTASNFVPTSDLIVDVLIVGGGGSGGFGHGGGGGGGSVVYGSSKLISSGTYAVVVGQGGGQSTSNSSNNPGGSSSIFGVTATGGGSGANEPGDDTSGRGGVGGAGANGGGGGYGGTAGGVGTAPTASGYSVYAGRAGGIGYASAAYNYGMGGGAGAGETPTQATSTTGGNGGAGVQVGAITNGINNYYWGGGGGGTTFGNANNGTGGSGGLGGGGGASVWGAASPYPTAGLGGGSAYNSGAAGSVADSGTGGAGGANTGGGGGGGANENGIGGAGGSGIVVVRYIGSQKATGGTIVSYTSDSAGSLPLENLYYGTQAAFVRVVPVSSSTSNYYKGRPAITSRLQSTFALPNNRGTIKNISPSPVSGSSATIYSTTLLTTTTWAFGIYNLSTATVTSLTYGTIITIGQDQGNTGTGNTVYFYTATNNTSIVAVATGGSVGPTNGYISGITVVGGTYSPTAPTPSPTSLEYFVVGGGGGAQGGGGGAGGVTTGTSSVTAEYRYVIQAGAGGASGQAGVGSTFEQVSVSGGGYGGSISGSNNSGGSGASGGGGGSPANPSYPYQQGGASAGGGIPGQGNSGGGGGWYSGSASSGGGGGGFSSAGTSGSGTDASGPWIGGNGGAGTTSTFSGSSVTYARGGGGWGYTALGTPSTAGTPGTGNGGGNYNPGGTGIVMVRYPDTYAPAWAVTGNPTVNVTGGYRIYSWTNTTTNVTTYGSIQFAGPSGYIVPNLGVPGAPGPWTFSLTDMNSTAEYRVGSVINAIPQVGGFGSGNTVRVLSITSSTEMVCIARSGDVAPSIGTVAYLQPTGAFEYGPEISNVTFVSPGTWTFVVSNLTSTIMLQPGSIITATTSSYGIGSFGTGTIAYVQGINNISQISAIAMGGTSPVAGTIGAITTSGTVISLSTGSFATLTFTAPNGSLTVTNNGTTDVTIYKAAGTTAWDNEARTTQGFTAPCTLEFFKLAGATDNSASYAMIGWNEDPTTNASYTSLDYAAYPYQTNSYSVHHNGTEIQTGPAWDSSKKFYIVYTTDGYIKHYNGTTLLYSVLYGTGKTVYIDSSFYSVNGTYSSFNNVRVKNVAWTGASGYGAGTADYSIVRTAPILGRQDNWDNIVTNSIVNSLNRPINYFGNENTEPKVVFVDINTSTARIRNANIPAFDQGFNSGRITSVSTVSSGLWMINIDSMASTGQFTTGTIVIAFSGSGSFGSNTSVVTVAAINSSTSLLCKVEGAVAPSTGTIFAVSPSGSFVISPLISAVNPYSYNYVQRSANQNTYRTSFNGVNDYYTLSTTPFAFSANNFTVEAWVYLNALPTSDAWPTSYSSHMVVATIGTPSLSDGLGFIIGQTKLLIQNNDTQYASTVIHGLTTSTWNHIAYVRSGDAFNFYVNGVSKGSATFTGSVGSGSTGYLGCETGQGAFFNGYISNLRMVNGVAVYTGSFSPAGVLARTQSSGTNISAVTGNQTTLLTFASATNVDLSTNNYLLNNLGTSTISSTVISGTTATSTATAWTFTLSNLPTTSTAKLVSGSVIIANTGSSSTGNFGTNNTVYVNSITNGTLVSCVAAGGTIPTTGFIDSISTSGAVVTVTNILLASTVSGGSFVVTDNNYVEMTAYSSVLFPINQTAGKVYLEFTPIMGAGAGFYVGVQRAPSRVGPYEAGVGATGNLGTGTVFYPVNGSVSSALINLDNTSTVSWNGGSAVTIPGSGQMYFGVYNGSSNTLGSGTINWGTSSFATVIQPVTIADVSATGTSLGSVTYSISAGALPLGAVLNSNTGIIYWYRQPLTSTATALVSVTASAAGSSESITKALTLTIQPGATGSGSAPISAMLDFTLTGANPTFNTVSTAWGWAGPGPSLTGPSTAYFSLSWAGKSIPATGIRIILQSAGGASSNNDGDPDSSANSGALSVFDIGPDYTGTSLDFWVGPAGPSYSQSGGAQQNVNPRQISSINNPIGAYSVTAGQGGYAGNAAYDAAVLGAGGTILGYAEGGPATVNYDSRNENAARPYINTGITGITSVIAANGPISPGRGQAPSNSNVPDWNFNVYQVAGTAYGRYSNVGQYGKGGREAATSGAGEAGFPAFVWVIIK